MSEEFNGERASITLKGGPGYDAPWIVVKGGSVEDAANELRKLDADEATLQAVANVAAVFHRVYVEAKNGAPAPAAAQPSAAPVAAPPAEVPVAAPAAPGPTCAVCHSPLQWKQAKPESGKTWKGWFCSVKDHPVQWAK